jgi:hypothetical protein
LVFLFLQFDRFFDYGFAFQDSLGLFLGGLEELALESVGRGRDLERLEGLGGELLREGGGRLVGGVEGISDGFGMLKNVYFLLSNISIFIKFFYLDYILFCIIYFNI